MADHWVMMIQMELEGPSDTSHPSLEGYSFRLRGKMEDPKRFNFVLQLPNCSKILLCEIAISKCIIILLQYNEYLEFYSRGDYVVIPYYAEDNILVSDPRF